LKYQLLCPIIQTSNLSKLTI